jgi:[protein-PII] uridylyltransferase
VDAALSGRLAQLDAAPLTPRDGRELARLRTAALDAAIRRLTPLDLRKTAIAAIGGYGRQEMTPASDVDLLIVYEPDAEDEAAAVAEAVLYPLWDGGLAVGHVVRTLGECVFQARRELESLTPLLSARVLDGPELLVQMAKEASLEVARADPRRFARRVAADRARREERYGRIGRTQDPDLKESLGGLRDLQTIGWLEAALGVAPPPEQAAFLEDATDLILAARTALHRVTGARENVIGDAVQEGVAQELGLQEEAGWEARDALMRLLARTGRHVATVVDELLGEAAGEATDQASAEAVGRFAAALDAHPEGWDEASLGAFVGLLDRGLAGPAVDELDRREALEALLPGWPAVAGRPQHDPYHRFPVDVHLVETAVEVARLLDIEGGDDPVAATAVASVEDRGAVLLGALLHDIGKVGRGSHVPVGVDVAAEIVERMGLPDDRRQLILFLVRDHLLLSDTATRRNLDDEDLILHVAARVGDRDRLGALYLLTLADAVATGPSASTPWRTGLIRDLVARVDRAFERGLMDPDRAAEVGRAEAAIRAALTAAGVEPGDVERFLDVTPPAYAVWVDADQTPTHIGLVIPPPDEAEVRVNFGRGRSPETWSVTVAAQDRTGLLSTIAGAFAVSGISILSARAFTTSDAVALDAFDVVGAFDDIPQERWDRFRSFLAGALEGRVDLSARLAQQREHYRPPTADVPVRVTVTTDDSDYFTLVEVQAADRLGLLFELARAFTDQGVDVHVAQAATYGPRIVDVFYVTEQSGGKLEDPERIAALRPALADAATPGES